MNHAQQIDWNVYYQNEFPNVTGTQLGHCNNRTEHGGLPFYGHYGFPGYGYYGFPGYGHCGFPGYGCVYNRNQYHSQYGQIPHMVSGFSGRTVYPNQYPVFGSGSFYNQYQYQYGVHHNQIASMFSENDRVGQQLQEASYNSEQNHGQCGHDSLESMVSSDGHETPSSSSDYILLSSNSSSCEVEDDIQQEDRNHLINYLNYLNQERDLDVTGEDISNSDMSMKIVTDANFDGHDPIVATDNQTMERDSNTTFGQRTDNDGNRQSSPTGSIITKPKSMTGCDDRVMFVKYSNDPSTKKNCCPFCNKLVSKLPRHMETVHKDKLDVQNIIMCKKGSKERLEKLESLRNTGRLNFNKDAALNKRELLTCRRPNPKFDNAGHRFKTCPYCYGSYTKGGLRLHVNYRCKRKPKPKPKNTEETLIFENTEETPHENTEETPQENTEETPHENIEEMKHENTEKIKQENTEETPKQANRGIAALSTAIEARHHVKANKALREVFLRFSDCELVRDLKFDWLIVVYGNKLAIKNTKLRSPDMIRNRLRLIARFLRELKRIEPGVTDLASMYHPMYFDSVVEAIQAVARYDEDTRKYGAPGVASSAVTAIKRIARHLKSEYIKLDRPESQRLAANFLTLLDDDIHDLINTTVNENQSAMRRRKVIKLPSLDDLKLLNDYIQSKSKDCFDELLKSFDVIKWMDLSKLTMISILIFNRKRVGDIENITLDDFKFKEEMNESSNQQLFEALSDKAKEIARRYCRMRVRGKKNRTVPVLLNEFMVKCLNILISHREDVGIISKNEYLFGLPPSPIEPVKVIKAGITLKKFVEFSGVKDPSSITGTSLRKQLATTCVSLKLDDAEVADVADFMGHAELVHRNSYRQNTIDRQVVQMSQWLEAALGNKTFIDESNRKTDNASQGKAAKLLKLLLDALSLEEGTDNENLAHLVAAAKEPETSSDVTMKSKLHRTVVRKAKKSSPVQKAKKSSPVPKAKKSSPVPKAKKSSSVQKAKKSSPVQKAKKSSPQTNKRISGRKWNA